MEECVEGCDASPDVVGWMWTGLVESGQGTDWHIVDLIGRIDCQRTIMQQALYQSCIVMIYSFCISSLHRLHLLRGDSKI